HHFPAGSLHAPYGLPSLLAVGKVTIKAPFFGENMRNPLSFPCLRNRQSFALSGCRHFYLSTIQGCWGDWSGRISRKMPKTGKIPYN
ncbi:MAG: hypothetical protein WCJ35_24045, partial [Planctomycetota bacterium]